MDDYLYLVELNESGSWQFTLFELARTERMEIDRATGFATEAEARAAVFSVIEGMYRAYPGRAYEAFDLGELR